MPELNKANRQCADVLISVLSTGEPFLNFEMANTTTVGLTSSSVYARAKGANKIAFQDPIEGTMTIEAQVYPFKFFALMGDGVIESEAVYEDCQTVTCETAGSLTIEVPSDGEVSDVFVYPKSGYGNEDDLIDATYSDGTITASGLEVDEVYQVRYIVNRSGVNKISFTNKKLPKDYKITQSTLDKDEDGLLTPFLMTAYKATIQRNFDLSFSSDGDPATITLTFDLMEDKNGNILDFVELPDDAE